MGIIAKIAWRNIWRNKRRSWVLITAIAIGFFCYVGSMSFADGFAIQFVNSSIELEGGHIQVFAPGYQENPTIRTRITDLDDVSRQLSEISGIQFAPQVETPGMVNSAEQAVGVKVVGVDPDSETEISSIPRMIIDGRYLSGEVETGEVVIGEALADRLNVLLGEKVVVMVSDLANEVSAGAYRVVGLFRSNSSEFDKRMVFTHIGESRRLLGFAAEDASTVSIHLERGADLDLAAAAIGDKLAGLPVVSATWRDRSPMLVLMNESYDIMNYALVVILFSAIAFSIINSFLMVIFERIREIGIMSANGLHPRHIRLMLYLEAVFIVVLGMIAGGGLSALLIVVWAQHGLDLSAFAEGVRSFNVGTVIYPYVDWGHVLRGTALIFVMVLLSVMYPAFKASRFRAVEAINYV